MCSRLFANGKVVYKGYVDYPRNTDNAWMETTAFHFHCPPELGKLLRLKSGDDAAAVTWLDVSDAEPRYAALYASHKEWVDGVAASMRNTEAGAEGRSRQTSILPERPARVSAVL